MHYSCLETGQSESLSQWSCVGWSGFFILVCSSCLRFVWMERETNTTFWSSFSCIFVLFFVLGGARYKIWAKKPIYPWF